MPSGVGPSTVTVRSRPSAVTMRSRFIYCRFIPCYPQTYVSSRLIDVLLERRILICVGSGGVGKTTTAATLALAAARRGKRTLVLTIDPARRLANSLGLAELGHEVQQVDPKLVREGAPIATG